MVAPVLSAAAKTAVRIAQSRAKAEKATRLAGSKAALPIGTGLAAGVTKVISDIAKEFSGGSPGTRALANTIKQEQKEPK